MDARNITSNRSIGTKSSLRPCLRRLNTLCGSVCQHGVAIAPHTYLLVHADTVCQHYSIPCRYPRPSCELKVPYKRRRASAGEFSKRGVRYLRKQVSTSPLPQKVLVVAIPASCCTRFSTSMPSKIRRIFPGNISTQDPIVPLQLRPMLVMLMIMTVMLMKNTIVGGCRLTCCVNATELACQQEAVNEHVLLDKRGSASHHRTVQKPVSVVICDVRSTPGILILRSFRP